MGVPGLFGWLRKKYPLIVRPASAAVESHEDLANSLCDNLYIGGLKNNVLGIPQLLTLRSCSLLVRSSPGAFVTAAHCRKDTAAMTTL